MFIKKLNFTALHLIAEHTQYLVVQGFFACRAEMDVDFVCGRSDTLHKVRLCGFRFLYGGILGIHIIIPFWAVIALRTHKTPIRG